ncbi:MAG: tetratricopeptide repeat protein, partial [Gemmatimonadaceae bacterium]
MPPWRRLLALGALTLASSSACAQSDTSRTPALAPESALRSGRYEDALAGLQRRLAADSNDMAAARLQLGTLFLLARAAEAESLGVRYAGRPGGTAVLTLLGRVQRSRGRDSAARASFERAVAARAPDSLRARLELARLDFDASSGAAAMAAFGSFIDIYNARAASLGAHELLAVALACRYLGRDQPSLYRDALRALDQALARDTSDDEATLEVAALFLDKYNFADAKATLDPLLARNPRHPLALGLMARLRRLEGRGGVGGGDALTPLTRALEVAPDHADLRALEAMVLLDHERFDDARAAAQRALQADATHATALAALEAVRLLRGDSSGALAVPAGITARSPDEVAYFSTLAEIAGRNRLYRQAADFARRALTADTADAKALALLGSNLLRVGAIGEGRERLELAFARDPYDVWTKNTLDLLDTAPQYEELEGEHVTLVVEKQDAALVSLYALPLAERAFAALASRYQWRPAGRVRIELYRSDADFSVRTVGLAGLDALGVSFGPVVALLAPAARDPGRYNWGSTLWHELAHTFTLGASAHRVPRWLSEGLSVYEERRA